MSAHTPGPWHVVNGVQIRGKREQIARVWTDGEGKANARLIAAAPALLSELQSACNYIDTLGGDSKGYRQALARATGEQA